MAKFEGADTKYAAAIDKYCFLGITHCEIQVVHAPAMTVIFV
jgi:hypothetical protein